MKYPGKAGRPNGAAPAPHNITLEMHAMGFLISSLPSNALAADQAAKDWPAYKNASLPVEERVKDLLGRMTLDEKIRQTHMYRTNILADDKRGWLNGAPVRKSAGPPPLSLVRRVWGAGWLF